jgi:hypothetical protein
VAHRQVNRGRADIVLSALGDRRRAALFDRASAGLMMVSGKPVARTSPRGQSIDWFGGSG